MTAGSASGGPNAPEARQNPSLVVLVVVDQLRPDLIHRYEDLWTGGFRRLLDEGFDFRSASHAHAHTETAAGHATISTGAAPSRHGIVANDWREPTPEGGWRSMYAVEDTGSPVLGLPAAEGRSPANMLAPGLAEWIRAANPRARVVALSRKDRSAITMAGRVRDAHVYWIDQDAGRFVTSRWYRPSYPSWVEAVNRDVMPGIFADTVWEEDVPVGARPRSRPDTADFEGPQSWFPHRAMVELPDPAPASVHEWVIHTPSPDSALLRLATAALDSLGLGRGDETDFLAVSFSQVDYVGHWFGPFSREQLDNLLRLDRTIGRLLTALDRSVGEGRWTLALTADHGVMPYPEWLQERGEWALRLSGRELREMSSALREAATSAPSRSAVAEAVARAAERFDFVERAYTHSQIARGAPVDSFVPLYRNARVEGRAPGLASTFGVEIRFRAGVITGHETRGTTHGSPYWYDRHVPLIFVGAGVPAGSSGEAVYSYDVAPTLAELAGIPIPSALDGRSLVSGWVGDRVGTR